MKTKKTGILIKIISFAILFQITLSPVTVQAGFWSDFFKKSDEFVKIGQQEEANQNASLKFNETLLRDNASYIFNMLLTIGIVLTVIVGGILGIQFMMASVEDKAKIKEMMIPYVLGCVVIYGAFGIWKLVIELLNLTQ